MINLQQSIEHRIHHVDGNFLKMEFYAPLSYIENLKE